MFQVTSRSKGGDGGRRKDAQAVLPGDLKHHQQTTTRKSHLHHMLKASDVKIESQLGILFSPRTEDTGEVNYPRDVLFHDDLWQCVAGNNIYIAKGPIIFFWKSVYSTQRSMRLVFCRMSESITLFFPYFPRNSSHSSMPICPSPPVINIRGGFLECILRLAITPGALLNRVRSVRVRLNITIYAGARIFLFIITGNPWLGI